MQVRVHRVVFTDLLGIHREVVFIGASSESQSNLVIGIDGSSVHEYSRVESSDVFVTPIRDSCIDIREDKSNLCVGVICTDSDCTERHPHDPRRILEETVHYVKRQGYDAMLGVELEFYVARNLSVSIEKTLQELHVEVLDQNMEGDVIKSYAESMFDRVKEEIVSVLTEYSNYFPTLKIHRENGHLGQYEVSFGPLNPVKTADAILLVIYTLKKTLGSRGLRPIFLPKPFPRDYGSGLHIHVSLWSNGVNVFETHGKGLPEEALYFIGGILEHAMSLAALTNPSINSYRRLVEGFEAPVYISWGIANRTTMIRVPIGGNRIEIRNPDATMNPYLGLAAILLAGIDGLKKKINPGDPVDYNVYRNNTGLKRLPRSLEEALDHLENDNEYLKPVFPKQLIDKYIELKREEARRTRAIPSPLDYVTLSYLF